jgi:hypothetical protein
MAAVAALGLGVAFHGAFKIGACQIVEQHPELGLKQVGPLPSQPHEQILLVLQDPIQAAVRPVLFRGRIVDVQQLVHGGRKKHCAARTRPVPVDARFRKPASSCRMCVAAAVPARSTESSGIVRSSGNRLRVRERCCCSSKTSRVLRQSTVVRKGLIRRCRSARGRPLWPISPTCGRYRRWSRVPADASASKPPPPCIVSNVIRYRQSSPRTPENTRGTNQRDTAINRFQSSSGACRCLAHLGR